MLSSRSDFAAKICQHMTLSTARRSHGLTLPHKHRSSAGTAAARNETIPHSTAPAARTARRFGENSPQDALQRADRLPDQHDRMRQAVRIAQNAVYAKADEKRQNEANHGFSSDCIVKIYTGFCPVIR